MAPALIAPDRTRWSRSELPMNLAVPCKICAKIFTIAEQLVGWEIRCQAYGQDQRIFSMTHTDADISESSELGSREVG